MQSGGAVGKLCVSDVPGTGTHQTHQPSCVVHCCIRVTLYCACAEVHAAEQQWRVPGVAGLTHLDGQLAQAQQAYRALPRSAPVVHCKHSSRVRRPVTHPRRNLVEEEAHHKAQVGTAKLLHVALIIIYLLLLSSPYKSEGQCSSYCGTICKAQVGHG